MKELPFTLEQFEDNYESIVAKLKEDGKVFPWLNYTRTDVINGLFYLCGRVLTVAINIELQRKIKEMGTTIEPELANGYSIGIITNKGSYIQIMMSAAKVEGAMSFLTGVPNYFGKVVPLEQALANANLTSLEEEILAVMCIHIPSTEIVYVAHNAKKEGEVLSYIANKIESGPLRYIEVKKQQLENNSLFDESDSSGELGFD
jgi:hypothetical protein